MPGKPIRVSISTPTGPLQPGRGFYQLEEDSLYVQIGTFSRRRLFYSFLESDTTRFDIDRKGGLIFLEISLPRRQWKLDESLTPPKSFEPADIRFLDFRCRIDDPVLWTNITRESVLLKFSEHRINGSYQVAENVVLQVDDNNHLVAVWISEIVDDLAGHELATFRKRQRKFSTPH